MGETLTLISALVLPLLAGVLLGTIFFGGLWWTIRIGVSSKAGGVVLLQFYCEPVLRWLASILSRVAIGAECWLAWLDLSWRASW
jgi:F1F0 ATPase subunit 2